MWVPACQIGVILRLSRVPSIGGNVLPVSRTFLLDALMVEFEVQERHMFIVIVPEHGNE